MFELLNFSPDWFVALGSILLLDLILSGDNAIIIALACKDLPSELRKKAIFWGTLGAVGLRVTLTLLAARLLEIPYLQFIGGIALVWIAIKLLSKESKDVHCDQSANLASSIKTILVADLVMSLDNVLSLAAVAQTVPSGKYSLLLIGLLASIPLVVWGSQIFLKLMSKFPIIIYFGAGILGYAAAEMIIADRIIGQMVHRYDVYLQVILTLGVIIVGHLLKSHAKNNPEPTEN